MKNLFSIMLVAFLISFLGTNLATAQTDLLPPQRLSYTTGNDNGGLFIDLTWSPAYGGQTPTGYSIFIAMGQIQDPNQFKEYDKVTYQPNMQVFHKKIYLSAGVYTIFLKAYNTGNGINIYSNPSNWIIAVVKDNNQDGQYIRIVSQPVDYAKPNTQYTYQVKAETNLPVDCPLVYKLLTAPEGMTINEQTGEISWTTAGNGQYPVSIQVGTTCKIAVNYAYQKFILKVGDYNNGSYIKITSVPSPVGSIGKPYIYQVVATSNVNCPIKFEIQAQPNNIFKFNTETGLLEVMVDQPTTLAGVIKAYLDCDNNIVAIQQFYIRFGDNPQENLCAKITGTVTYEDGTIPEEGIVTAMGLTNRNDKYPVYMAKLQQGVFSIPVPEGTFIVSIDGIKIQQEFYENAANINDAKRIDVKCGDSPQLTIVVAKKPEPVKHTVTGRIFDSEDGTGIMGMVEFIPLEKMQNQNYMNAFSVKTDADGKYTIDLPAQFTYRAHAIAIDRLHTDQWYDQAQTQMEADLIVVEADVNGIDFPLKKFNQQKLYGFAGKVINLTDEPVLSMLQAIPVGQPNQNIKNQGFFSKTDDQGLFTFTNLPLGKYVVLSIPVDKKYVPGYYKLDDIATLKWRQATVIEVTEVMTDVLIQIKHRERTGLKGVINLSGNVIATGTTLKNNDTPMGSGIPLAGAFVFVLDEYGQVSDYAFTDATGHYNVGEISEGNSSINVDMYGFAEYSKNYTGDYTKSFSSTVDIQLEPDAVAGVDDANSIAPKVFPIPANDFIYISCTGLTGQANVMIYDNTGSVVYQKNDVSFNNADVRLQLNLPSGIYSVIVTDGLIIKRSLLNIIR